MSTTLNRCMLIWENTHARRWWYQCTSELNPPATLQAAGSDALGVSWLQCCIHSAIKDTVNGPECYLVSPWYHSSSCYKTSPTHELETCTILYVCRNLKPKLLRDFSCTCTKNREWTSLILSYSSCNRPMKVMKVVSQARPPKATSSQWGMDTCTILYMYIQYKLCTGYHLAVYICICLRNHPK